MLARVILVMVDLSSAAALALPTERLGAGIALNMTARQLGGALGIAGLVALITATPGIDGFKAGWAMCGIAAVATALVASGLGRVREADGRLAARATVSAPSLR